MGCRTVHPPVATAGPRQAREVPVPSYVAVDTAGNVYITGTVFGVVRVVNTQAVAITIAGVVDSAGRYRYGGGVGWRRPGCAGQLDSVGDGCKATLALMEPAGTFVDPSGNLFIADCGDYRIREVICATGASVV